jgi:hypothetical protein
MSDFEGQGQQDNTPVETGNVEPEGTTIEQNDSGSGNPAWEEALNSVPEEFHPTLREHFGNWDKGVQKRFETVQQKYSPYNEFVELGVSKDDLAEAMQIRHLLNSQPRDVYDWLVKQHNFGQNESQGQQEAEPQEYDLSEENDLAKNPQIANMQRQLEGAVGFINNLQQTQLQDKINRETQAEVEQIEAKYPGIDISAVARFAMGEAAHSNSRPNLMAAAEYLVNLIPQQRVSDTAPPVISGGSRGVPQTPSKKFGDMTSDERAEYVANMAAGLANS